MSLEELLYTTGQEKLEIGIQKGIQEGLKKGRQEGRKEAKLEDRSKFEELLRKKGINDKIIAEMMESLRNED